MVTDYWKKTRATLFPWITDWTDPQDHIRNEKDLKKLDWFEWFFLHPSAYNLIIFGGCTIAMLLCFAGAYIANIKGSGFVTVSSFVFGCLFAFVLVLLYNRRDIMKNTTYYDMFMREDPEPEDKNVIK